MIPDPSVLILRFLISFLSTLSLFTLNSKLVTSYSCTVSSPNTTTDERTLLVLKAAASCPARL